VIHPYFAAALAQQRREAWLEEAQAYRLRRPVKLARKGSVSVPENAAPRIPSHGELSAPRIRPWRERLVRWWPIPSRRVRTGACEGHLIPPPANAVYDRPRQAGSLIPMRPDPVSTPPGVT
jgi:hypothetical protein